MVDVRGSMRGMTTLTGALSRSAPAAWACRGLSAAAAAALLLIASPGAAFGHLWAIGASPGRTTPLVGGMLQVAATASAQDRDSLLWLAGLGSLAELSGGRWFPTLVGCLVALAVGGVAVLAVVISHARERRLEAEMARRAAEWERLGELAERINTAVRLDDVLDHVYSSFRPTIPYDRIGLALIEPDGRTMRATWARGETSAGSALEVGYEAPLEGSSLAPLLESGEPRILGDLERYLAEHPGSESTRRIVADGLRSSLTCPLTAMGRPVGFLFFSSRQRHAYTADHVRFFQRIAHQLSHSVARSRLYDDLLDTQRQLEAAYVELERLAAADPLTGLANRRSFDLTLELEWRRGARTGQPLAVLMVDVDHFKRFNDAAGHAAGDECLRRVAAALVGTLRRAGETVARYGGEEFVAVLPETGIDEAKRAGERLRAAVAALAIEHPDLPSRHFVTISVGGAAVVPGPDTTPSPLVEAADRALYTAKQRGRDRVEIAD